MKKTIIALLALGGVAMATTYSDTELSGAITLDTTSGGVANLTYTLDLNVTSIISDLVKPTTALGNNQGAVLFVFSNGGNKDHTIGLGNYGTQGLCLQRASNNTDKVSSKAPITFNGNYFKGVSDSSNVLSYGVNGENTTEWYNFANTSFWEDVTSATLTITNSPTTDKLYSKLTVTKPNDVVYTVTGESSNSNGVIETYATSTSFQVNTNYVTGVTFSSIPEPTTATLSLLALAGLAARRRRR